MPIENLSLLELITKLYKLHTHFPIFTYIYVESVITKRKNHKEVYTLFPNIYIGIYIYTIALTACQVGEKNDKKNKKVCIEKKGMKRKEEKKRHER